MTLGHTDGDPAAVPAAVQNRKARGNGAGSVYHVAGRRRPWAASVVIGWAPNGRPIRRARYAATQEEAEALLARMVVGEIPERFHKTEWKPVVRRKRSPQTGREVSKRLRFRVLQRDGFACVYCGRRPPEVELHLDHRTAFSRGGQTSFDNLVTACADCNRGKHTLSLDDA